MHAFAVLTLIALEGAEASAPQRLTMDEVVQMAVASSPALKAARARARGNEEQANSLRGRLLPSVNLSDEYQRWDSRFVIDFPIPSMPVSIPARELSTNAFVVAAGQPLLGLLHLSSDRSALATAAEAATFDVRTLEANLRDEVRAEFLRMFEARTLAGVAHASQDQLAEQIAVAKEKLAAGVLTPADVLRLNVAAANARQQEIQATAAEQVSRATLLVAIDREPEDRTVSFVEPVTPESAAATEGELGPLVAKALHDRSEVRSATLAAKAASASSRSRAYDLLPEVDLEAGYMHVTGQAFVKPDSAFIGIKAGWQIWDWGARWYQHRAAQSQAVAAQAQADDAHRRVEIDVAAKLANARATASALETGRTAIGSAEEAYRVTTVLLAAGSANTTDLLDAQSALTQARLNFARARYEYALARIRLSRALGE
ncbi:MAG TPA: TolC family protein [Polyangia bacterium]